MTDTCVKHSFELAADVCRQCKHSYCSECLIYSFGEKKPPYCVTCALNAAGVRHKGAKVNPKAQKKGLFGRKKAVVEEEKPELGFYDINIVLPDSALNSPMMENTTRREASPELVAAVSAAEAEFEAAPRPEPVAVAPAIAVEEPSHDSLAGWASSLSETPGFDDEDRPAKEIAAWPEF